MVYYYSTWLIILSGFSSIVWYGVSYPPPERRVCVREKERLWGTIWLLEFQGYKPNNFGVLFCVLPSLLFRHLKSDPPPLPRLTKFFDATMAHQHCLPGFDVKMRWCVWCKPKHYCDLIMRSMTEKRSLQDWLHSASMVERAIAVWSLLTQITGQLQRLMTYPVRLRTLCGSCGDS